MAEREKYFNCHEAAAYLGVDRKMIYLYRKAGAFPNAVEGTRACLIPKSDLDNFRN